jgi:aspartate racemase
VPDADDRATVHRIIYDELVHGKVLKTSRDTYLAIVDRLQSKGAQGIILGCTEIGLLITPTDLDIGCFDSAALHVASAVNYSLS